MAGSFGCVHAQRATGCLLDPRPRDLVLILLQSDVCYVLSVLERPEDVEAAIVLPARTRVTVDGHPEAEGGGTLAIAARDLTVTARETLHLQAGACTAKAATFSFSAAAFRFVGELWQQQFRNMHTLAEHVFEKAARAVAKYGRRSQRVEGLREEESGRLSVTVRENARVRAHDVDVRTEGLLSMDGKHITLG